MILVPVVIHGKTVNAVLGTAAQVTVISDQVIDTFPVRPEVDKEITMHAAGRDMKMKALKLKPIDITGGSQCYSLEVFSAPIEDDMLLGLDFLYKYKYKYHAKLDMENNMMQIGTEQIPMFYNENRVNALRRARVILPTKIRIPALSVVRTPCKLQGSLNQYLIEPEPNSKLLSPKSLHNEDSKPMMSFVNYTNKTVILRKNQLVGIAHEIDDIIPEDPELVTVSADENTWDNLLSEHIKGLFEKSCEKLIPF